MLRFQRLIPSPFYTRWCLCIQAGSLLATRLPMYCHGHRRCMVLPTSYGGQDGRGRWPYAEDFRVVIGTDLDQARRR